MGVHFTPGEHCAIDRLRTLGARDLVFKTDRRGFIVQASPELRGFGFALGRTLFGPHLLDLAGPVQREAVAAAQRAALMGFELGQWTEFRAAAGELRGQWFEIQLGCRRGAGNRIAGTLAVVRGIAERKALEERLFAAEMTDPLTGLTNRKACLAMLGHLVAERIPGSLALVSLDYLKAINLRHGQAMGDEVLVAFAAFVQAMMRGQDIVSRFGGQSLAVLLPGTGVDRAEEQCRATIETLARLGWAAPGAIPVTASAGVVAIGRSLDETIRQAELALVAARAKGRNCVQLLRGFSRAA